MARSFCHYPKNSAIVAAQTTRRDAGVIHDRPQEAGGVLVARIASENGHHMGRRLGGATVGRPAVVATGAACASPYHYACMVERCHQETGINMVCMACVARRTGRYMHGRFAQCCDAVMAGLAHASHCCSGVVENGAQEGGGVAMTSLARRRGRDMGSGFCLHSYVLTAMAARTSRRYAGVVHHPCRKGGCVGVASLARRRSRDVT